MRHNSRTILNKRVPSLFGFLVLFLAIGTITWLSSNAILFGTQAATGNTPKGIRISNITDKTFTVSYTTDDAVIGTITFGRADNLDQVVLDDRDKQQNSPKEYTTHHITVENLSPATLYAFTISSGDENFLDGGKAYQITTGPPLTHTPSAPALVAGKVTHEDGNPAEGAIVYLSAANSQLLSTLVTNPGMYQLDVSKLRTNTFSSPINLATGAILQLQILDGTQQSNASLLTGQTNPIPLIILSKNYNFAVSNDPLAPSSEASESASTFPIIEDEPGTTTPKILTPQKEQEFSDQQPLFRGKAVPNETVTITINSEETITATVTTDTSGNWQYRPNVPLEPGNHTITIRTIDAAGLMRVITQQFVVHAEGSQFTEPSVSPSASITPSPTQQATATPTRQPTNAPSPTKTSVTTGITQTPTKAATATLTRTTSASISPTTPPVPVSGNSDVMIFILGVVTTIGIGALLFVFATL